METENPYQPPKDDCLDAEEEKNAQPPVYNTRWQATRAGFRRGAVLGLKISAPISAVLIAGVLLMIIIRTIKDAEHIFSDSELFIIFTIAAGKAFGAMVVGGIMIILFCAIPGGLLMGLIESLRYRNPK